MKEIYTKVTEAASKYSKKTDFITGADIAGFIKVADKMLGL